MLSHWFLPLILTNFQCQTWFFDKEEARVNWGLKSSNMAFFWHDMQTILFNYINWRDAIVEFQKWPLLYLIFVRILFFLCLNYQMRLFFNLIISSKSKIRALLKNGWNTQKGLVGVGALKVYLYGDIIWYQLLNHSGVTVFFLCSFLVIIVPLHLSIFHLNFHLFHMHSIAVHTWPHA